MKVDKQGDRHVSRKALYAGGKKDALEGRAAGSRRIGL